MYHSVNHKVYHKPNHRAYHSVNHKVYLLLNINYTKPNPPLYPPWSGSWNLLQPTRKSVLAIWQNRNTAMR